VNTSYLIQKSLSFNFILLNVHKKKTIYHHENFSLKPRERKSNTLYRISRSEQKYVKLKLRTHQYLKSLLNHDFKNYFETKLVPN